MKCQPRLVLAEAERRLAAEHVDVVAAQRQVFPELGGDDAASTDRGIADDADIQGAEDLNKLMRGTGSRTMKPSAQRTPASAPNCASRLSMSWRNNGVLDASPPLRIPAAETAR